MTDIELLRYPIGKFIAPETITRDQLDEWIDALEKLPLQIKAATAGLSDAQLDTPYRPGGWTIRQVVHHLPDSHLNAYIRFKLALTEDNPVIKAYHEDRWAECEEARSAPVNLSTALLYNLHMRWVAYLRTLTEADLNRTYIHPEHNRIFRLKEALGLYVWHGKHHLAHITETIRQNNWQL